MEFAGKTALITGAGAAGGIGAATAALLHREGAMVVISGRNAEAGEQIAKELGDSVRFVAADLTDLADVQRLAAEAGAIDILINNAAAFLVAPALEQGIEGFDQSFAVNVRAPYFLTAAVVPGMITRGGGSVVNVSTMAARKGIPGMSVYGASKAALEAMTRTFAAEFAASGVRVNVVSPGPTRSGKLLSMVGDNINQVGSGIPLGRVAELEEIAQVIAFVASDKAAFMTGTVVSTDGGRSVI